MSCRMVTRSDSNLASGVSQGINIQFVFLLQESLLAVRHTGPAIRN